ncbi:hypothetical protein [Haloarcula pellucida]|uniref:Uncharacterized protein n=1 Tax=Haloarcula pellucida TaxID=1427151 RepID=A0A830GN19_9EURY|nr:hypothetical protein [Halomicroarcula pellucida]MBX0348108.1 hypothetical protein [Halomicroarcula pellucida]GGN96966.1 hypothetical protein GCM10009030_25810 [Halomicroarcula pellucida]
MAEEPLHERMDRYETLAAEAADAERKRDEVANEVGAALADVITEAVEVEGTNVVPLDRSADGHRYRFTARLDRAALVARLTESLPEGFVVSNVNDDGSLGIEWTGDDRTPSKREHGAILKAIVAEATVMDADGFIESVPSRKTVLERAAELGVERSDAADRLSRLATLDIVDIADGRVYPDENFSRY